jgi:hypothetical protein
MSQPLHHRYIPAEIFTTQHYIFGRLKVTQSGLMGMLSDVNSSYLEMSEASLALTYKPDKVVNYAPFLNMVRSRVVAIGLGKRDYLGLQGVIRSGYQRLYPYPVQITTASYDITGTLDWYGRMEFMAVMSEGTNDFLLINDASLTAPLFPALHVEAPVILINRAYIETMVVQPKVEG